MTSSKFFAFLVGLSAFCIAGSAAGNERWRSIPKK